MLRRFERLARLTLNVVLRGDNRRELGLTVELLLEHVASVFQCSSEATSLFSGGK